MAKVYTQLKTPVNEPALCEAVRTVFYDQVEANSDSHSLIAQEIAQEMDRRSAKLNASMGYKKEPSIWGSLELPTEGTVLKQ